MELSITIIYASCFSRKKTIAWFHGAIDDLDISDNSTAVKSRYNLQKNAWGFADKVVTISHKSLQSLETVFPEYMHKAQIIYNAFDVKNSKIKATERVEDIYENCYLPIIVCAGRLDKNKNFSLLVKTVAKLKTDNIKCALFIIGDGEEREPLVRLVAESGITDSVFFLGYKQNPLPYISRVQLLCVSSLAEGFPTVVLESMALGKPFVTTPVAGASEELADGGKCGLVADWNVDDYAEKVKMLLTDKTLYDRMSENCIKKIQEFSIENTVKQFDILIASLPEKKDIQISCLSKREAFKKVKAVYVWLPDEIIKRIKFSITRFASRKTLYNFMLLGYHILNLFRYILCTPVRICTAKKVLLRKDSL